MADDEECLLALVADSNQITEAAQSVIHENLELRAERDRLRAVVEDVRQYRSLMTSRVEAFGDDALALESELHARARVLYVKIGQAIAALVDDGLLDGNGVTNADDVPQL